MVLMRSSLHLKYRDPVLNAFRLITLTWRRYNGKGFSDVCSSIGGVVVKNMMEGICIIPIVILLSGVNKYQ